MLLKQTRKHTKKVQQWANVIIANIFKTQYLIQKEDVTRTQRYIHTIRSLQEIAESHRDMVIRARGYLEDVEFSPMDASRTEPQYLYQILEATIKAGATTVNIPDTVGYAVPEEFGNLIQGILDNVPNIHQATVSVHCHNDLGLAVANSLEALRRGARQVECTINGIGERAGNIREH